MNLQVCGLLVEFVSDLDITKIVKISVMNEGGRPPRAKRARVVQHSRSDIEWLNNVLGWALAEQEVQRWNSKADAVISKMSCCSCCGVVKFGSPNSELPPGCKQTETDIPPA